MPSPYSRRSTSGIAVITTLSVGINDSIEAFSIDDDSGWPSGAGGSFYAQIDNEVIDCASQTAGAVTVVSGGRGASDTPAASHLAGATVSLVFASADADDANYVLSETVGKVTATQDLLVADGAHSLTRLAITNNRALIVSGSTISWGQLTSAMLATDSVGSAQIAADAVGSSEIATDAVGAAEIAANAVGVTEISTAIAGSGLTGGGGSALAVGVDGTTIEITADALNVKAAGIGATQLAAAIPRGFLGYAESSASDQTGIGNGSYVNLTGVSVAVTAGTNRKLKITVFAAPAIGTAATDVRLAVRESTTVLGQIAYFNSTTGSPFELTLMAVAYVAAPSAGSHTYIGSVQFGANSDNAIDNSFIKSWILVEDIGGV